MIGQFGREGAGMRELVRIDAGFDEGRRLVPKMAL